MPLLPSPPPLEGQPPLPWHSEILLPRTALSEGAGLPLGGREETGGYKGFGLALMVEVGTGLGLGLGLGLGQSPKFLP